MRKSAVLALMFALTPALALAYTKPTGVHMHPQLFHDRAPKQHTHAPQPHHSNVPVVHT